MKCLLCVRSGSNEEDEGSLFDLQRQSQQGGIEWSGDYLFLLLDGVGVDGGGRRAACARAAAAAIALLPAADEAADEVDGNGEDDRGILLGGDGTQRLKSFGG